MFNWTNSDYIAAIAAVIAFFSAVFAYFAYRSADKTYRAGLIGQLYTLYQSDEMLTNLKITWEIYRRIWVKDCNSTELGIEKANNGFPIRAESAILFFNSLDVESSEFKAIHYMINYWAYVGLLLKRKILAVPEIIAFTSPYILGFLVPMARAYDVRYPNPNDDVAVFEYTYKKLVTDRKPK